MHLKEVKKILKKMTLQNDLHAKQSLTTTGIVAYARVLLCDSQELYFFIQDSDYYSFMVYNIKHEKLVYDEQIFFPFTIPPYCPVQL